MSEVIKKYRWNPALNLVLTMKNKVLEYARDPLDFPSDCYKDVLHYWAALLTEHGEPVYEEIINNLIIVQYKQFLLLHYNFTSQFDGDPDDFWEVYDGLYMECRSVVIDILHECLALTPFRKFRNLNEGNGYMLEDIQERICKAKNVEISEKLDGSMMNVRWYDGSLIMTSSNSLNPDTSWRLADAMRMFDKNPMYMEMVRSNPHWTFIFEYISKKDAHVVQYDHEGLYLIGIRDTDSTIPCTGRHGIEFSYTDVIRCAEKYGVPTTQLVNKTFDQILTELDDKKANEAEGFVVNIDGFKVKVKYNDYVAMHKMLTRLGSVNCIIRAIADGTYDDLLSKIPEAYRNRVLTIGKYIMTSKETDERIINIIISSYNQMRITKIEDNPKAFADFVNKMCPKELRGYVFCKRNNKPYNVLKNGPRYKKWKEICPGIDLNDILEDM